MSPDLPVLVTPDFPGTCEPGYKIVEEVCYKEVCTKVCKVVPETKKITPRGVLVQGGGLLPDEMSPPALLQEGLWAHLPPVRQAAVSETSHQKGSRGGMSLLQVRGRDRGGKGP